MNWVHAAMVVVALAGILAKEIDDINDISIPPPPINLDSNLRKALLRALTELENEDKSDENGDNSKTVYYSTTSRIDSDTDKIVEKASASAVTIFANSEVRSSSDDDTDETTTTKEEEDITEKPIVIVQKSNGIEQQPITSNNLQDSNNEEQFIASASSSFTEDQTQFNKEGHQTRSVSTPINFNSVSINDKSITSGVKSVSITPKTETTSPLPTTTTEESEAKVKPEDVQFFSAPLVAAFTVHQDAHGLPEKVEPIYKTIGTTVGNTQQTQLSQQQARTATTQNGFTRQPIDFTMNSFNVQTSQQTDFNDFNRGDEEYRKQLAFRQKQSTLEQQIFKLEQQQKKQQDYLLRQQQVFQNQFDSQRALNENVRLAQNDAPFIPIPNPVPHFNTVQFSKGNSQLNTNQLNNNQLSSNQLNNNQLNTNHLSSNQLNNNQFNSNKLGSNQLINQINGNHFNNQNQFNSQFNSQNSAQTNFNKNQFNSNFNANRFKGNTVVSFQPSLSLTPEEVSANILPLNAQILPVRNAVDFRQVPVPQDNFQQYNSLTPPVHNHNNNNNNNFGSFQTFPNNFVQSLPNVRQSNRVFRQEPATGNFGLNNFNGNRNNFNQFQSQSLPQQQQQQNRFFRSSAESFPNTNQPNFNHQPQNVNQHLNNLLFQSGIRNVRQNDDLSIVSKVLSYNVGRDNLFVNSRVNEQRLPNH